LVQPRRSFLKAVAGAGLATAASPRRVMGANDRVRVGVIGVGLIGKRHLLDFLAEPDCQVAAICEVYPPRLEEGLAMAGGRASPERDFRRLLDRPDLDAVVVSTPDHWHAPMTILACAAGKDVYVEKPLTHVVREGRWMVQAARHYRRVVQVGTQQRSGAHYKRCVDLIRSGHIGEVRSVRLAARRNVMPGFTLPVGRQPLSAPDHGLEFCGTKGTLTINRAGLEVLPDADIPPDAQIPQFTEPPRPSRERAPGLRTPAITDTGYEQVRDQFKPHVRNFLDCVKS